MTLKEIKKRKIIKEKTILSRGRSPIAIASLLTNLLQSSNFLLQHRSFPFPSPSLSPSPSSSSPLSNFNSDKNIINEINDNNNNNDKDNNGNNNDKREGGRGEEEGEYEEWEFLLKNKEIEWGEIVMMMGEHPYFISNSSVEIAVLQNIQSFLPLFPFSSHFLFLLQRDYPFVLSFNNNHNINNNNNNGDREKEEKEEEKEDLIDQIMKVIKDPNRAPIVVNECLKTISVIISLIYNNLSQSYFEFPNLWKKITFIAQFLSFNPMWDKKDNFLSFISSLYLLVCFFLI